jgi:CheY-like chemotaxis protein
MEDAARAKLDADRRRAEEERLRREEAQVRQLEDARQRKLEAERQHQDELLRAAKEQASSDTDSTSKIPERAPYTPPEPPRKPENVPQQKIVPPPPPAPPLQPVPSQPPAPQQQPVQQQPPVPQQRPVPIEAQQSTMTTKANEAHDMYKRVLLLAWADGAMSPEEESQLRDLRTSLRITMEEHVRLELEAKEESYAHAFTLVWTSGMNAKERSAVINELRQKYHVSAEAHSRVESRVLTEFGHHQNKPTLYVIDDEESTLGMIVRVLEGGGYAVYAFNTSDEALIGLQHDLPDLIVSDINLETSTIGGFSFYEKVRQLPHLSHVPFIFLSGMIDEGMIRYGKGLGADDYLTKPFSGEMLLDTIKGKLKRYKQLKNN